jgi:putative nucleotidyltransferase with HDIG domain
MSVRVDPAIAVRVRSFPAMSASVLRVLSLLQDPESDATAIETELRWDPGLTANLLKIANSSYFGCSGSVGSVRDAVVRLGLARVYQLVVTASVNAVLEPAVPGYDTQPGEMWRHAVAVSVAAECLADELEPSVRDDAFTAGLLHDVGKLVLGEFVQKRSRRVEGAASKGAAFDTAEKQVLGVDHAEVGAQILKGWLLPENLVEVVRWHHHPDALDPPRRLVDIVHVADVLCISLGFEEGREGLHYELSPAVMKRLGLKPEALERVAMQTLEGVEALGAVLGVENEAGEQADTGGARCRSTF